MAASVSTTSAATSAAGRRCRRPPPGRFSADLRSKNCPSSIERQRSTSRATPAAAVTVAGVLNGHTERRLINHLLGGDLEMEFAEDGHVYMTGPAVQVFEGDYRPQ